MLIMVEVFKGIWWRDNFGYGVSGCGRTGGVYLQKWNIGEDFC